jgi:threonyl-tRNA synthetase
VRGFIQDDAHIFCTAEQVTTEAIGCCKLLLSIYRDFGFDDVEIKFADRPPVRVGSDAIWDRAEHDLKAAVEAARLAYTYNPGEGAFYGPKLEFHLRDALGRQWQCGTVQLDFNMPGRLGATYVGEDGGRHTPIMLHRAILGSIERFIGILIEHYAGAFPLWLAPVQAVVASIVDEAAPYAEEVARELGAAGLRVATDTGNEKIGYKVREHSLAKVPLIIAVGRREAERRSVSLRRLGSNAQEALALGDAVARLKNEAAPPG